MEITDMAASIDRRLTELEQELRHLIDARAKLLDAPTLAPKTSSKPADRRSSRRPTRARAAYDVVPAGKLRKALSGSSGMSKRELSRATKGGIRASPSCAYGAGGPRGGPSHRGPRRHAVAPHN